MRLCRARCLHRKPWRCCPAASPDTKPQDWKKKPRHKSTKDFFLVITVVIFTLNLWLSLFVPCRAAFPVLSVWLPLRWAACQDVSGSDYALYQLLFWAIVATALLLLLSCFSGIGSFPALSIRDRCQKTRSNIPGHGNSHFLLLLGSYHNAYKVTVSTL